MLALPHIEASPIGHRVDARDSDAARASRHPLTFGCPSGRAVGAPAGWPSRAKSALDACCWSPRGSP